MSAATRSGPWLPPAKIVAKSVEMASQITAGQVRQGKAGRKVGSGKARNIGASLPTTGKNFAS